MTILPRAHGYRLAAVSENVDPVSTDCLQIEIDGYGPLTITTLDHPIVLTDQHGEALIVVEP